ncbi:hypothetical protein A3C26_03025 [Candidatus Daviesbacteria bacterium RIFCSPHIGHO2_02_FULL_39_12]|uniref:DOT1 domain-containing protein n=2 Tax=Candidatus Daviesiibacteriota TaxID=1752718 RepID=A0A1F5JED4_9BACT|nr:MAG: hypothetical protein A3C26_03025 [Candidatus Daviesbacteria bacterium RIFCSPHIGHO2_02_FULL_39_12]OGE71442.1 MAG: hypothetical protein A3H40_02855 [Candidatus Daviesbacteria bacterium RIFCSPLOWO2_02_FULL_38_15]
MESTLIISGGVLLGCLIALSWFAGSDAPYIPTNIKLIRQVLKLAGVKKGKKFYELGSGDGRVVLEAAKLGAESTGIEQSYLRVLFSRHKARRLKKAHFFHGNIFDKNGDIGDADIVYIYLLAKGVKRLEEKLQKELKKGSIVITQTFHFPNWKPFTKLDFSKKVDLSKDIQGAGNFQFYKVRG